MNKIMVTRKELEEVVQQMSADSINLVEITFVDKAIDQHLLSPEFLNISGIRKDGFFKDYETIPASYHGEQPDYGKVLYFNFERRKALCRP